MISYEGSTLKIIKCKDDSFGKKKIANAFMYLDLCDTTLDILNIINVFGAIDVTQLLNRMNIKFSVLKKELDRMIEYKLIYCIKVSKEGWKDYFVYCLDHWGTVVIQDLGGNSSINYWDNVYIRLFKAYCMTYESQVQDVYTGSILKKYSKYINIINFKTADNSEKAFYTTSYELLEHNSNFKQWFNELNELKVVICMYPETKDKFKGNVLSIY